jgi:hypothetical protein
VDLAMEQKAVAQHAFAHSAGLLGHAETQ